ncbi:MAG: response regulator [Bacillota bacterium]
MFNANAGDYMYFNSNSKKILVVEDEPAMSELLSYIIRNEGYKVDAAFSGEQAIQKLQQFCPDLVMLDLVLPDASGYDICRKIVNDYQIPVIMLTSKSDVLDKVLGLEFGADDYITKPFDPREVMARIKTTLRRSEKTASGADESVITVSESVAIYKNEHKVINNGVLLELTPKEYDLLLILAENKGNVFSRTKLLETVWGYNYSGGTRTVDIHVRRLRQKIGDEANQSIIQTVFGVGYKIKK